MEKKKREEFIDIAKGIAILCVIIGHTWKNAYPADKRLMVFIYSFHMPLFFILSGWCLKSTDVKISSVIVKKIKQLVVPYVVEYSCAATPQIRQTGNRLSGLAETAYASLLAQCFV